METRGNPKRTRDATLRVKPSIVEVEHSEDVWEATLIDANFILENLRPLAIMSEENRIRLQELRVHLADPNIYSTFLEPDAVDENRIYAFKREGKVFRYVLMTSEGTKGERAVGITVALYNFPGCKEGEIIYQFHGRQMAKEEPNNSYILEYGKQRLDMKGVGRFMDDMPELARGKHLFGLYIRKNIPYLVANYNIAPLPNMVLKVVWSYGLQYWLEPEQLQHLSFQTMVSMKQNNQVEWNDWVRTYWNKGGKDSCQARVKAYDPGDYIEWLKSLFNQRRMPKLGPGHIVGVRPTKTPVATSLIKRKPGRPKKSKKQGATRTHNARNKHGNIIRKWNMPVW